MTACDSSFSRRCFTSLTASRSRAVMEMFSCCSFNKSSLFSFLSLFFSRFLNTYHQYVSTSVHQSSVRQCISTSVISTSVHQYISHQYISTSVISTSVRYSGTPVHWYIHVHIYQYTTQPAIGENLHHC